MARRAVGGLFVVLALLAAACSGGGGDGSEVRLGYFANVTHAPAIVGVVDGHFQEALGEVALRTTTFNAGTEAVEAIFSGALDMSFIGPNPAVNAYAQSDGMAIRIVAGTTSGGAALVVSPAIATPDDLAGTTLATPSLGNTQDVALRAWLADQGYATNLEGGGDVSIVPQANAQTLETFRAGQIDGAWVPEPWASRLVVEGGGHVLVDERELWPEGRFVTTHLIVATGFLEDHPDVVAAVLRGLMRAEQSIAADPAAAQQTVNDRIEAITGNALGAEVLSGAWETMTFTLDPIASSLRTSAEDAVAVGLLDPVDLADIYDLDILNGLLAEAGLPEVSS